MEFDVGKQVTKFTQFSQSSWTLTILNGRVDIKIVFPIYLTEQHVIYWNNQSLEEKKANWNDEFSQVFEKIIITSTLQKKYTNTSKH